MARSAPAQAPSPAPALVPANEAGDVAALEARVHGLTNDQLRSRFLECYQGAAESIRECALLIKEMESRGMPLTGLPRIGSYRRIASGQIDPSLFWEFIESKNRDLVERLPLPDQRRLASDPFVPVIEPKPGGGFTSRKVDMREAPRDTAKMVLHRDSIRSPEEQAAYLGAQKTRPPAARPSEPIAEPLTRSVSVKLTEAEHRGLTINAARLGLTTAMLARRGLVRSRVLEEGHA